ncbi:YhdP family protein [Paraburkholderia diazotrophica]|uniref:TIGR02099 family protein n=1 Tax=Paraburkholderia diazotrophica TaxID=667676 RepID=A0A1H7D9D8_9BURK|nr:YhdP family protein [Paraburkholderia diazotrophica]SEJ96192.1 TIGR02099 family protein [Paraburkholderia diazotrophica]
MSERNSSADPHEAGRVKPVGGSDHVVLRHTLRVLLSIALFLYFVVLLAVLGLRYLVLPYADSFRPRIEAAVSEKIHAQLRIGKLAPHWTGFQPGLEATNVTITNRDGKVALMIPHASATVSWSSVWKLAPILSSVIIDKPDLLIERETDGSLTIAGVTVPTVHTGNDTFSTWLLRQQAMILRGGTLRWHDTRRDAPEIALQNIRLAILSDGYDHKLALQAPPDGKVLFGPLDFRAHFRHARLGAMGKPINWTGEAYISTGPVDLPMLARYMDFPIETYAGRIDNAIWLQFTQGRVRSAAGELSGNSIALRVKPTQPKLDVPVARFSWAVAHDGDEWTLDLRDLRAELGQPPLDDGTPVARILALHTLSSRYRVPSVQHGQLISITGDRVDLGILAEFSRALPLPRRLLNNLVRYNPRGLVADYTIEVERGKPDSGEAASEHREPGAEPIIRYRFKGDLQGISIAAQEPPPGLTARNHPRAGIPGIENLWGNVDADERHGALTIDTANAAITMPGVFDDPRLTFDHLSGKGTWTIAPAVAPGQRHKAFDVQVSELNVSNADTAAKATASYSNIGSGRGSLDLKAEFERAQVTRITRYLPTSISEKLRIYLGHGLQAGMSRGATIEIHGNLDKFPYSRDPKAGVFRIVAPFKGGRFDPSPYPPRTLKNGTPNVWPALDGIDGEFQLKENLLRFDAERAHYKRIALNKVTGKIDDLGTRASSLVITGDARGPLADMLDYVNNSALGGMTKHQLEKLHADGPAALALKLTVPRTLPTPGAPRKPRVAVEGSLAFENDRLSMDNVPPLSQLRGKVRFTDHTAQVDGLTGQFMGGDVRAKGGLNASGAYALDVSGHVAVDAARGLNLRGLPAQVLTRMNGSAPYDMSVRGAKGRLPDVAVHSDLTGLALDFPAPFNKPIGTPMPIDFTFRPTVPNEGGSAVAEGNGNRNGLQRADLTFGPIAATYLLRHAPGQPPEVVRGAVGVNRPADLPSEGVTAAVDIDALDADAWRALFLQMRKANEGVAPMPPSATAVQFMPNRFAVHIGTLTLLKRRWESVVVGASRYDKQWQANIASNQVSGHVSWLPGATPGSPGTLQARLARLVIPSVAENDLLGPAINQPAQNIPSIDLVVNELIVRGRNFGKLEVNAHNFEDSGTPVWQLDSLEISNPAATLKATANWRTGRNYGANQDDEAERSTELDFKLDIKDAGALLERAGLPRTLKAGEGSVSGKLGWRGGPTKPDYPTLNGNLAADLRHGQILKVDPGVAKLLGVLSLQSLARYASMDFRDVIGEGLPFEHVTGTASVENGIGTTNDFEMVTAPARAQMKGSVDLPHETQDLKVHIVPTVSAGAGVVAAAVINPLLGLGALVADIALSHSIEHAFAVDYAITGSWAKPHVERVHTDRGNMNAPAAVAAPN